jgi:hypothetical protein
MMRYYTYVEEPTLDSYRLDYWPRDQLGTVLICPWVVVTGKSGAVYHSMRALPLPDKQTTVNLGTYRATGQLDEAGELMYSFRAGATVAIGVGAMGAAGRKRLASSRHRAHR